MPRLTMRFLFCALLITLISGVSSAQDSGHKAAIERLYAEAFNAGDLDTVDAITSPEYINHGFGDDLDVEGFKAAIANWRSVMPDFQATIEVLITEGNWAASRLLYRGRFANAWRMGDQIIEPNNEVLEWSLQVLHRFDAEGRLVEDFTTFDRLDLLMQLEAAPLPDALVGVLDTRPSGEDRALAAMETPDFEVTEDRLAAHREAFTRVIEHAINNGDLSAIETYMAEDYITHEPFGDFTREQFRAVIEGFREAVPDLQVEIEAMVAEGDWLAARLIYTGTFTNGVSNGLLTVEPTDEPIRFVIHVLVRFNEEGVAVEDFKEYNRLAWLQQVGLLTAA